MCMYCIMCTVLCCMVRFMNYPHACGYHSLKSDGQRCGIRNDTLHGKIWHTVKHIPKPAHFHTRIDHLRIMVLSGAYASGIVPETLDSHIRDTAWQFLQALSGAAGKVPLVVSVLTRGKYSSPVLPSLARVTRPATVSDE